MHFKIKVMTLHRLSATFPTMQLAALFSLVDCHSSRVSKGGRAGSSLIGQLVVEAGPEEAWIAVALHQGEDLILGQLERGGAKAQTQALSGGFSDCRVHVDLEGETGIKKRATRWRRHPSEQVPVVQRWWR